MKRVTRVIAALIALLLCMPCALSDVAEAEGPEVTWLELETSGENKPLIYYIEELGIFRADYMSDDIPNVLFDRSGRRMVPEEYSDVLSFNEGRARVSKVDETGKLVYGFIDESGSVVIPLEYDGAGDFSENVAWIAKRNEDGSVKYGLIDRDGSVLVPPEYDVIQHDVYLGAAEGLIMVGKYDEDEKMKYGFVDTNGSVVIQPQYDEVRGFSDGAAWVIKVDEDGNTVNGFINMDGDMISQPEYNGYNGFSEGFAAVSRIDEDGNEKWGYIDKNGFVVIPFEYDYATSFIDGRAWVGKKDFEAAAAEPDADIIDSLKYYKFGFIDRTGAAVTELEYGCLISNDTFLYGFSEGLAPVQKDGNMGFIDRTGRVVIPLQYSYVEAFEGGYAVVGRCSEDGVDSFGIIDRQGREIVPIEYGWAWNFSDGLAMVAAPNPNANINANESEGGDAVGSESNNAGGNEGGNPGKIEGDNAGQNENGNADESEALGWKYGFVDETGSLVLKFDYDDVSPFIKGCASVLRVHEDWTIQTMGFINKNGREIVPPIYDNVGWVVSSQVGVSMNKISDSYLFVELDGRMGVMKNPTYTGPDVGSDGNMEGVTLEPVDGMAGLATPTQDGQSFASDNMERGKYSFWSVFAGILLVAGGTTVLLLIRRRG